MSPSGQFRTSGAPGEDVRYQPFSSHWGLERPFMGSTQTLLGICRTRLHVAGIVEQQVVGEERLDYARACGRIQAALCAKTTRAQRTPLLFTPSAR